GNIVQSCRRAGCRVCSKGREGRSGQYFLRGIGRDSFIATIDVLACLRSAGVPLSSSGKTKKDQQLIQQAFNDWEEETGLSFIHLS
ncbi:hypothetical protein ACC734_38560, partial [Rhizobium ruizarguesonis]